MKIRTGNTPESVTETFPPCFRQNTKPATETVNVARLLESRCRPAGHGMCALIGYLRGPAGHHRQATSRTRARRSPSSSSTSFSSSACACCTLCGSWLEEQKLDLPAAVYSEMLATGRVGRGQRLAALWPKGSGWRPVVGTGKPVELRASWHG